MSVKGHEAVSIDFAQDRLLFGEDFLGTQLRDLWSNGGTGGVAVVDAQTGGIVRVTTGALTNNSHHLQWGENPNEIRSLHVDKKVTIEVRAKLNQTTQIAVEYRLRFDWNNYIFFNYNSLGGANWFIRCRDGGAGAGLDSGIAADTSYHIFRIECFPPDEVHFYIDGVETANSPITTNIPDDAGDFLQPALNIQTLTNLAKSMDIDYIAIRQEI